MSQSTQTDNPWKDVIEAYFEDFMKFFFRPVHAMIDWKRGCEFLDQELQQVSREALIGRRHVDKLVKVWRNSGDEVLLYIHIEIQAQKKENFPLRMYVYNYRLFERYGQPILSLAILSDNNLKWAPDSYSHEIAGCQVHFKFLINKLLNYQDDWYKLETAKNPFSIVVQATLKALETQRKPESRFFWKKVLYQSMYEKKYSQEKIRQLIRFIDWVLYLPKYLAKDFKEFVDEYEEKKTMPYITSMERISRKEGIQLGILQNSRESIIKVLQARFKDIPAILAKMIQAIEDIALLSNLLQQAVLVDSLESFEQLVAKAKS